MAAAVAGKPPQPQASVTAQRLLTSAANPLPLPQPIAAVSQAVSGWAASRQAQDDVAAAWRRARDAGSYAFAADIVQQTIPSATLNKAGRSSKEERLYLEGQTDLSERKMEMVLYGQNGTTLQGDGKIALRVEGDKIMARQGDGIWQESDGSMEWAAPQGDFMTFLAAAKEIANQGSEARTGVAFARYTFSLDGKAMRPTCATSYSNNWPRRANCPRRDP